MKKLTVTIEEVAVALGIGRNSAYAAAKAGQIPTIRVGKRLLVPVVALEKILSESAQGAAARRTADSRP